MTLRIGDIAPDFQAETTEGPISFHQWLGDSWGILFSHPKDFTPVCTTELGTMAQSQAGVRQARRQGHRPVGRSGRSPCRAGPRTSRTRSAPRRTIPMIGDSGSQGRQALRHAAGRRRRHAPRDARRSTIETVRTVYVIGPDKKIKLALAYPMTTGRNFDEILRAVEFHAADREVTRWRHRPTGRKATTSSSSPRSPTRRPRRSTPKASAPLSRIYATSLSLATSRGSHPRQKARALDGAWAFLVCVRA